MNLKELREKVNYIKNQLEEEAWLDEEEGVLEILIENKWEAVGIDKFAENGWSINVPGKVYDNEKIAKDSGLYKRLEKEGYSEKKHNLRFNTKNKSF